MKAALVRTRSALLAFVIGLAMGVVYWALHTQSPAPALIGLAGLSGIVVGERVVLLLRQRLGTAKPMDEG